LEGIPVPEPSKDEVQLATAHAKFPFKDAELLRDMDGENGFYIREAMLNLALCNTAIPEEDASAHKGTSLSLAFCYCFLLVLALFVFCHYCIVLSFFILFYLFIYLFHSIYLCIYLFLQLIVRHTVRGCLA
jgi:hypothetical protein